MLLNHDILQSILAKPFLHPGLSSGLVSFIPYLQTFALAGKQTVSYPVDCSVPQGSVLGPLGFNAYTEDIVVIGGTVLYHTLTTHSCLPVPSRKTVRDSDYS